MMRAAAPPQSGPAGDEAQALHDRGLAAYRQGHGGQAVALIERAIATQPDVPAYHGNLGSVLSGLGRYGEATKTFRRAIAVDPDYALGYANLGFALGKLGGLERLNERLGLEFCGVDFTLAPDGSALVFEATPAITRNDDDVLTLPYLRPHYDRVSDALRTVILRTAGRVG